MSDSVIHLLDLFDALPEMEKQSALNEILLRVQSGGEDPPTHVFDGLADELFVVMDAEEAAHAQR